LHNLKYAVKMTVMSDSTANKGDVMQARLTKEGLAIILVWFALISAGGMALAMWMEGLV
jgi:hypothetical protein